MELVMAPRTIIIMGVSGSGKSVVGRRLAERLGGVFEDGDDFHPPSNKAKMSSGTPLTDEDRLPWYGILRARVDDMRGRTPVYVLACSALKATYRDWLRKGDAHGEMVFVLLKGGRDLIHGRMAVRKDHFMPVSLLDSQLATLEETEDLMTVSIEPPPEAIVEEILDRISKPPVEGR